MFRGFREFISTGNVIDLAVAVVIGAAFATVVEEVVTSIITPIVNSIGGVEAQGFGFRIVGGDPTTFVNLAAIINAVIVFLITAAVVYFVFVLPMNTWRERKKSLDDAPDSDPHIALLTEIRDLLEEQRNPTN